MDRPILVNSDQNPVLVLSGTIPGEPGVGGVILKDLVDSLPASALLCAPVPTKQAVELGWLSRCPQKCRSFTRQYETGWRPFEGIIGEFVGWSVRNWMHRRHCDKLVNEIIDAFTAANIRRVWAVLDCPTVIEIAAQVSQRCGVPLSVMVWDAPELLTDQLRLDRWSGRSLISRFTDVIHSADRVGVICEQMQAAYEKRFGAAQYVIMRHGTSETQWQSVSEQTESTQMRIGFAGSITAQQPFQQFIRMLDSCGWIIAGKPVTLRLIGSRYTLDSRSPQSIEYFGWRSPDDTIRLLAECDLLYLPQPFETHLKDLAELSFPTKLSTYLAVGKPILLHAPAYGSIVPLYARYQFGTWCNSLDLKSIQASLTDLCLADFSSINSGIQKARIGEFSSDVFLSRFNELAGPFKSFGSSGSTAGMKLPVVSEAV